MQGQFAGATLQKSTGLPLDVPPLQASEMRSVILKLDMRGTPYASWFQHQRRSGLFNARTAMSIAYDAGEPLTSLRGLMKGPAGVITRTARQTNAIMSTAVNQTATRAHRIVYESNPQITDEYVYTAILDEVTTDICMSLDGRIFRFDDPKRREPPQHFKCRSIIVPIIKYGRLGITPPTEGVKPAQGGSVASSTRYAKWLRLQPHFLQDEILGPGRAKLFRAGKLSLGDLVRRDGRTVTLTEIRRRIDAD